MKGNKVVAGELPIGSDAILSKVQADRVAQGLPPTIQDPASLAMIAAAVRATIAERAA